jgi:hypothetical protein
VVQKDGSLLSDRWLHQQSQLARRAPKLCRGFQLTSWKRELAARYARVTACVTPRLRQCRKYPLGMRRPFRAAPIRQRGSVDTRKQFDFEREHRCSPFRIGAFGLALQG